MAARTLTRREVLVATAALGACAACAPAPPAAPRPRPASPARRRSGVDFVQSCVRPWPELGPEYAFVSAPGNEARSYIYDAALAALVLTRADRRADAGRVLGGLAARQREDGALPFSIPRGAPEPGPSFVRSGALAWVGYAAADYLGGARDGPHRDRVAAMAHRVAGFLLRRRVGAEGDPRRGLVTGGSGTLRYEKHAGKLREVLVPGEIPWTSVEHNLDAFFFLRALARTAEQPSYEADGRAILAALLDRAWLPELGQFARGVDASGPDRTLALDCASWGALALRALGDERRARVAADATARYLTTSAGGVTGHRPYAEGFAIESWALRTHLGGEMATLDWRDAKAVWPEGTAGVALALARVGDRSAAAAHLRSIDGLRGEDGSLPTSTAEIASELGTGPGIAGTAWFELVRPEIEDGAPSSFLT